MRRVYFVYFVRQLFSPFAIKAMAVALLFLNMATRVSVFSVFRNAPSLTALSDIARFFISAFTNTGLMVQMSVVGVLFFGIWIVFDMIKRGFTFSATEKV